jgi:hypothetical protein
VPRLDLSVPERLPVLTAFSNRRMYAESIYKVTQKATSRYSYIVELAARNLLSAVGRTSYLNSSLRRDVIAGRGTNL